MVQVSRRGTIRLETEDGTSVGNRWNIEHLRKYHLGIVGDTTGPLHFRWPSGFGGVVDHGPSSAGSFYS
jgi:hypothetical protein